MSEFCWISRMRSLPMLLADAPDWAEFWRRGAYAAAGMGCFLLPFGVLYAICHLAAYLSR